MKRLASLLLMVLGFGGFIAIQSLSLVAASSPLANVLTIDGAIDPVSADFLSRGIDVATENDARLLVVLLDTPGGLLSSTREMVEKILDSDIPVVVYVSPPGAQAASAGTFVTAAAHFAAMAPTTNIGAASPVGAGGEDLPDTLKSKATQDAAAFIRSIAEKRDRNAKALEDTVLNAVSYTASEALNNGIIDLIAQDMEDLLSQLNGLAGAVKNEQVVLETEGLEVREINRTPVEQFLGFLANPDIAFLLLSLGGLGLIIELFNPGQIIPGMAGVILLALAFVALGNLPVNWVGVGLIVLSMTLFFAEAQAPGIGVFGIGGVICFILGGFFLFGGFSPPPIHTPSFRVSLWVLAVASAFVFGAITLTLRAMHQAKKARVYSGSATRLIGRQGVTTTLLDPHGTVRVSSELWSAVSDDGQTLPEDEEVVVLDVEGLTLRVFRASQ